MEAKDSNLSGYVTGPAFQEALSARNRVAKRLYKIPGVQGVRMALTKPDTQGFSRHCVEVYALGNASSKIPKSLHRGRIPVGVVIVDRALDEDTQGFCLPGYVDRTG